MSTLEFRLPDVGEGIAEAEIVAWHIEAEQPVRRDQPLLEIETDKSVLDIPAPCDGVLEERCVSAGEVVPVGTLLARIAEGPPGDVDGHSSRRSPERQTDGREGHAPVGQHAAAADAPATPPRPLASPATRKLASRLSLGLSDIEGTGPAGRVTREDVERAARDAGAIESQEPEPGTPRRRSVVAAAAADQVIALRGIRRQVARSMSAAAAVPTIYEWRDVDATALMAAVRRVRDHLGPHGPRVTVLSIVTQAVAAATAIHPRMNATFDADREELTLRSTCHIGIATATDDGLIVPIVRDARDRSLASLAAEIEELSSRARRRATTPDETGHGSITISNFGSFGTVSGTPLLRLPEVAIVGVGRVVDRVVALDGAPVVRATLPLSVATDHRVNDGVHLAAFCATLEELLGDPVLLLAGA